MHLIVMYSRDAEANVPFSYRYGVKFRLTLTASENEQANLYGLEPIYDVLADWKRTRDDFTVHRLNDLFLGNLMYSHPDARQIVERVQLVRRAVESLPDYWATAATLTGQHTEISDEEAA